MSDTPDFVPNFQWNPPEIEAYAEVSLPAGMTQEEADRLVREADEKEYA